MPTSLLSTQTASRTLKKTLVVSATLSAMALATLVIAEIALRGAIALGIEPVRDPALYLQPFCNDDYHKLRFKWQNHKDLRPGTYVQDADLGWVPDPSTEAMRQQNERLRLAASQSHHVIGVFGDSFAAGVPPVAVNQRIPPLLQSYLSGSAQTRPTHTVANWAVSGYGVDQIYLRLREALAGNYGKPPDTIVIGVLLEDIDRALEHFRAGPKPYFTLEAEGLRLNGVPIEDSPEEWIAANPVGITSWLKAMIQARIYNAREWRLYQQTAAQSECRRPEKEALASEIIRSMVKESRAAGVEPLFVVFFSEASLTQPNWRKDFLLDLLVQLDIPIINTASLIRANLGGGASSSDLYLPPPNGHLNAEGNRLVAEAIYRHLAPQLGLAAEPVTPAMVRTSLGAAGSKSSLVSEKGLSPDSESFSWTTSENAMVVIDNPFTDSRRLRLQVETLCALRGPADERVLTIAVNARELRTIPLASFADCWLPDSYEITIPEELASERRLSIEFRLPDLLSPAQTLPGSLDERRLGIALSAIVLSPS